MIPLHTTRQPFKAGEGKRFKFSLSNFYNFHVQCFAETSEMAMLATNKQLIYALQVPDRCTFWRMQPSSR